ncbi:MAG: glutamyl-tRNA reductase, partial [Mycobacteriales bacterium]
MKLLVVGIGYRSASPELLAALAAGTAQIPQVLSELLGSSDVAEALVVSTCNRVEVYAAVRSFHGALSDIATVLARRSGVALTELAPALYAHYADEAVRQIFTVVTGLDSLVQGERQVLGQVRTAYAKATRAGAVGSTLHEVMQRALRAGKRVHAQATVAGTGPCMADSALRLGVKEFGSLRGVNALVVGAGEMGTLAAAALRDHGVAELTILSRSLRRAHVLAATVGAQPATLDQLGAALCQVDVAVFATRSPQPVLDASVAAPRLARPDPLLLVDLAMPADISPRLEIGPGVTLVNLASLAAASELVGATASQQVAAIRRILSEELAAFTADRRTAELTPMIVALRERAQQLVRREMSTLSVRAPRLTEAERADVARAMRRL